MYSLFAQTADAASPSVGDFLQAYWPILVPVLAGLVGVYLLLPQAGRFKPVWGAVVAAAAFIAAGILVVHCDMVLPETILFYTFSAIAVMGGVMLISQTNPVHAALSFALVVLSTCGLFLLQGAPFLMASTIIVYAGAIIVTFLFVIMLAQQAGLDSADQRSREPFLGSLAGFVLLGAILCVLQRTYDTTVLDDYLPILDQVSRAKDLDEVYRLIPKKDVKSEDDDLPTTDFFSRLQSSLPKVELKLGAKDAKASDDPHKTSVDNAVKVAHDAIVDANLYYGSERLLDDFKQRVLRLHGALVEIRIQRGSLAPRLSRTDREQAATKSARGTEKLPTHNVAGLGRTLFTDYLLPVELAGVLLLVASIGAIVIAGRRSAEGRA
jgi:NADH-quinone oxidoreductase subunit J